MKILIIEDNEGASVVLKHFLAPVSSRITIAKTMEQALKEVAEADDLNLITVDLGLPDSDVSSTLKKINHIRKTRPDSLIVVVTGQEIPNLEAEAIAEGADGLVYKQGDNFTAKGFLTLLTTIVSKYVSAPTKPAQSICVLEMIAKKLAELQTNEKAAMA